MRGLPREEIVRSPFVSMLLLPSSRASLPAAAFIAWLTAAAPAQNAAEFRFAREDVLGSSSSLVVTASSETVAKQAEAAVFAEVARLAAVLSTWDEHSELSRLIAAKGGKASPDLIPVLQLAERWRKRSHGAFEPGVASLTRLWAAAEKAGKAPDERELAAAATALATPAWTLAKDDLVVHAPFTLDGIAKGYIVDLASKQVATIDGAALVSFQIGGDTRLGKAGQKIALADPRRPSVNGEMLATLTLADGAVASSGSYARGFDIGGVHHSHILDPRTGRPCDAVLGASVVATDTATADALATALCVLGPEEGLKLLAGVPGAEGIVTTADGKTHSSKGMAALEATEATAKPAANNAWPKGFALQVDFEIKAPANSGARGRGGWKRPYVAVWIDDLTGTPARTLCLWGDESRWLRELRRWSRENADTPRLVQLVSQATRKAGSYTLTWDGNDDEGRALAPGRYTVIIEAAREHGTYQLMRKDVELGDQPLSIEFEDNDEIGKAKITFGKVGKKGT